MDRIYFFELTEVAAISVEWVVNSFTLKRKYKSYFTLQNICLSGLITIMSLLKGGGMRKNENWVGGGGMVIGNGDSKNSTNPPYLVKNERSLSKLLAVMTSAPPLIAGTTWVNLGPGTKKFGSYKEVIVLNILKYKYCVGKSRNLELLTNWWRVQERKSSNYMCLIYIKHF